MCSRAGCHFDRFQIELAALAPAGEDDGEQIPYFPCRFLLDRFGRFFPSADSESWTGLARQIFSLTSSNCRLSFRKRRKRFADRPAVPFPGQAMVGPMRGLAGLMAAAIRSAAAAADGGDRTPAEVTQPQDLGQKGRPLLFER